MKSLQQLIMKVSSILLILLFLTVAVKSDKFNTTVKCQACSITCPDATKNCFRVTSDGYDRQVCAPSGCVIGRTTVYQVQSCAKGVSLVGDCSTQLCYVSNSSICSEYSFQLDKQAQGCSIQYNYSTACGACKNASNNGCTSDCYQLYTNGALFELCLTGYGMSCSQIPLSSFTIKNCSTGVDDLGSSCTCCLNSDYNSDGFCTSKSPALNSSEFTAYGKLKAGPINFSPRHALLLSSMITLLLVIMI